MRESPSGGGIWIPWNKVTTVAISPLLLATACLVSIIALSIDEVILSL